MDYDLTRLGPDPFERLLLELLKKNIGRTPKEFRNGAYGGREAAFGDVSIAWPPDLGGDRWDKLAVVNVEFRGRSAGIEKDTEWYAARVHDYFSKWLTGKERRLKRVHIPYTLFVTNVALLEVPKHLNKIQAIINEFGPKVGMTGFKLWHYQTLCNLIDKTQSARQSFAGLITPSDALFHLEDYRVGISPLLCDVIKREVATDLMADQWVRLSQVRGAIQEKLSLSTVGIDLPLADGTVNAARYIVEAGERILRQQPSGHVLPHVVLVGGPGQGKTTIGQIVCQTYRTALIADGSQAGTQLSSLVNSHKEGLQRIGVPVPRYRRWPIRIDLSNYADAATGAERTSLLKYMAAKLSARTSSKVESAQMRKWLKTWPWLVVLDGLDEVASASARDTLMDQIHDFTIEADIADSDLFIVATTRPQGYAGEFTSDRYQHISLASLTPTQAIAYAKRLAEVRHAEDPDMQSNVTARMRSAASEQFTARLMRSPLQVTIMSILLEARERAPQARYALFDAYYDTIYAREVSKPGPMAKILESRRNDINALHDRIGLLLQTNSEKRGEADASIPKGILYDLAVERIGFEGYSDEQAQKLANDILKAVTQRLVLIVPKALDDVGFEIRSIQEFTAARALVSDSDSAVRNRLREIVPSAHWRNTWLFAAGRVFAQREHIRSDLIELLAEVDNSNLLNLVVAPGADLALDLLDDDLTSSTPALERVLARHALTLLQYPPDQDLARRALVLLRLAIKDDVIAAAAEQQISQALNGSESQHKAAEVILRVWKEQSGRIASRARQVINQIDLSERRSWTSDPPRRPVRSDPPRRPVRTVGELVKDRIEGVDLNEEDRALLDHLVTELDKLSIRPIAGPIESATIALSEIPATRSLLDEALSRQAIADLIAHATIDAGQRTWSGASELRNILRAWLQRRYAADKILALTPFIPAKKETPS